MPETFHFNVNLHSKIRFFISFVTWFSIQERILVFQVWLLFGCGCIIFPRVSKHTWSAFWHFCPEKGLFKNGVCSGHAEAPATRLPPLVPFYLVHRLCLVPIKRPHTGNNGLSAIMYLKWALSEFLQRSSATCSALQILIFSNACLVVVFVILSLRRRILL